MTTAIASETRIAPLPKTHAVRESPRPRRSFGFIYAWSIVVLTILFVGANVLLMGVFYDDLAAGLGVGVMSAFWGAPGFGIIVAGAIYSRHDGH